MLNKVPTLEPILPSIFTRIKELIAESGEVFVDPFKEEIK